MTRRPTRTTSAVVAAVGAALALAALPAVATSAASAAVVTPMAARDTGDGTNHIVSADEARRVGRPAGVAAGAPAAAVARAFATQQAGALGLRGELAARRTARTAAGTSVVSFDQEFSGVPVIGGQVVVEVGADGTPRGALSETLTTAAPSLAPGITAAAASKAAIAAVARDLGVPAWTLTASAPELSIFDPALLDAPSAGGTRLVWQTEVRSSKRLDIRQYVLVDARKGVIALSFSQIHHALDQDICDQGNVRSTGLNYPCADPVWQQDDPTSGDAEVRAAALNTQKTYEFYSTYLGRDSIDGAGMTLVSTVRYCPETTPENPTPCPYPNAFWDGSQMVYGAGFAKADDVVAHELTHGVTERTSRLFYFFQSGALNESLSDIFGEFVDQTDGVGNDSYDARWKLGEDLDIGSIRDMKYPPRYGQPDWTGSALYSNGIDPGTGSLVDGGDVHANSGVGNKFAYLVTDGTGSGSFRGYSIRRLGIAKAAKIIYGAAQLLTTASDYSAFAAALKQSCASLKAASTVTTDDCNQVTKAINATGLTLSPANAKERATPLACAAGYSNIVTWKESFETKTSAWSRTKSSGLSEQSWYWTTEKPYGQDFTYATDGDANLWGDDPARSPGVASITMTSSIPIAKSSYLTFDHAFSFFRAGGSVYGKTLYASGGRVLYSTDDGRTWKDAAPLMTANGYNGTLYKSYSGFAGSFASENPLKGRNAFVGASQGHWRTKVNLGASGGSKIRLRFQIGTDYEPGDYGWFIDNLRVGHCDKYTPRLTVSTTASTVYSPRFTWSATDDGVIDRYILRSRTAAAGAALPAWGPASTVSAATRSRTFAAAPGTVTCLQVTAVDKAGRSSAAVARCTSNPVDDRSLTRSGTWADTASSAAYLGTLSTSTSAGASLGLNAVNGNGLALIVAAKPGGGTIGVYVGTKKVATVSTSATTAVSKRTVYVATGKLTGANIRLKVESPGTGVAVDGLSVTW
ncbi:MAG: M4 family metallopeptidase [Actinobacteria bacterium]|nr:M4 family metallopeptidase [Actinomycetota bacterium]